MTKRKTPTAVDPRQSKRDAVAATVAMGKLLPADEGDPAHQPIKDWSVVNPNWCSVDDLLDYIAEHGRQGIPQHLIDEVLSRTYGSKDDDDDGSLAGNSTGFLISMTQDCAKIAKSLNYATNMMSLTFASEIEKDAVGEICDRIDDQLVAMMDYVAELDRRVNAGGI